jgi:3'-phosphoadenosine 5'-phosphosulfate sulfotransferase (PAPS reductase)/FAD synthetase
MLTTITEHTPNFGALVASILDDDPTPIEVPAEIEEALRQGAALVVSISGGKDSQALLRAVVRYWRAHSFTGAIIAVHADLGRIEWQQSLELCERECAQLGVELIVVRANIAGGDMVDRWALRRETLDGAGRTTEPHWSSSQARYCTSDMKRNPIDTLLRLFPLVVSVEGVRAEESPARAKKPCVEVRKQITAKALKELTPADALAQRADGQRVALNWRPLRLWTVADVWRECGTSVADIERRRQLYRDGRETEALDGCPVHPAYIFGNDRVSCVICILASANDIKVGARHRPDIFAELVAAEEATGFTFKAGHSLRDIVNS